MRKKNKRRKSRKNDTSLPKIIVGVLVATIAFAVIVRAVTQSSVTSSSKLVETHTSEGREKNTSKNNIREHTETKDKQEDEEGTNEKVEDQKMQNADDRTASLMEQPIIPVDLSNYRIEHTGYTSSYNLTTHCPNWVAWELTEQETRGVYGRSDDYREDETIPYKHRVNERAYSSINYDRGHMCPAGDMKWSENAMSDTFYMTNMCPQDPTLNQHWWERLESACRRWAKNEGSIYICCGPIFVGGEKDNGIDPIVKIPSAFFKVVLSLRQGHEKAIGFYYKNDDSRQPMGDAVRTVDEIEEMTGFDFFSKLEDEVEARVEAQSKLSKWN